MEVYDLINVNTSITDVIAFKICITCTINLLRNKIVNGDVSDIYVQEILGALYFSWKFRVILFNHIYIATCTCDQLGVILFTIHFILLFRVP